jgi:hypothetical protein
MAGPYGLGSCGRRILWRFKGLDAMSSRLSRSGAVVRAVHDSAAKRPVVIPACAAGELDWPATPGCW